MSIYAIGDLHLSGAVDKPMDMFGDNWINHATQIKNNWLNLIESKDTILIPGDISWAMNMEEAMIDLEFIHKLPGKKILVKGNHDYWWKSVSKLNTLYEDMFFIQNNFIETEGFAICGSRGWLCPNDTEYTEHDYKIYNRELQRLELSLKEASKAKTSKIIVMMHYPPTNDKLEKSGFIVLFEKYNVEKVIYGHLHGNSFKAGLNGFFNGVEYKLVSCDYINFKPILIA
ncbi:MAG TPA: metallophosphoesterase [Defluviitaleaceae bacterium]|jgi:predicted phosphohydrolase|nr:serine/threonine protein phosphatase [Candidatus Epulonipiscium sp.]HOA80125.1 metallophosphoesterase [Defluviitaleaceae bacterium]